MDRVVTLINIILSEESLKSKLYLGKLKDELLLEEDLEAILLKLFEPMIQDEAYFLHDVGKSEIFTMIHRVFGTKQLPNN